MLHCLELLLQLQLLVLLNSAPQQTLSLQPLSQRRTEVDDYYFNTSPLDTDFCGGQSYKPGFNECPQATCSTDSYCHGFTARSRCVCDRQLCGSVCVALDKGCDFLPELINGRKIRRMRDWNENALGQIVAFRCNQGYNLLGSMSATCQANQVWNTTLPSCQTAESEYCPQPRQMPHTVITPFPDKDQYAAGDEFVYTCAPGYRSDSPGLSVTAICTKGVWSMHEIMCSIISCGHPGNLQNGRHVSRNYTFNQKVSYFCNEGFQMQCSVPTDNIKSGCQVRTCQADGRWSGSMPVCKQVTCPALPAPKNGKITKGWNTVDSVVQYSCNDGYRLIGQSIRQCRRNGEWDGDEPRCAIQDCGAPPTVPNAYRPVYRSTKYEAKAAYTCLPDTKFEGENGGEIICQKSGQWYPPPPRCRRHCKVPIIHLGTPLVGKYDGPVAVDKVQSDTTLWIRCNDNHRLHDVFYPRCDNGTWTRIPKCVPMDCEDRPPLINKGIARFYGTKHGDKVDYKCYVGYEITHGFSSLTCRYGKWVGKVPKCSRKQCPWIPTAAGIQKWLIGVRGAKNPWTRPETRANHEEIVSFKCKAKGYILQGHTHTICINGRWRPGRSPRCVLQMHKLIPSDWLFYRTG